MVNTTNYDEQEFSDGDDYRPSPIEEDDNEGK